MKLTEWLVKTGAEVVTIPGGVFDKFVIDPRAPAGMIYMVPENQEICERCLSTYPGEFEHVCAFPSSEPQE